MTVTNRTVKRLHRKEWQMMSPAPASSAAGSFIAHDRNHLLDKAFYCVNATTHYLYSHDEDSWVQAPSGALAGTWGAGAAGCRTRWSRTMTANGGSTTTITVASATWNLTDRIVGRTVRMLGGTAANVGQDRIVAAFVANPGGTATITLNAALPAAVANADSFAFDSGRVFVVSAGTLAAGAFKEFDIALGTWGANLAVTNLPASLGTDGKLAATPSHAVYASGTATGGAASTLTNTAKAWTVNSWANSQVRIVAGTGVGQIRTIASNTGTVLTVSAAWTTTPDATSQYVIEANDDFLYYLGNGAVTLYRYSISANTWTVLAPAVARAAAPSAGVTANFMQYTGHAAWADESNIQNGRYIYSFRGGATGTLDRYDIALNAWAAITYSPLAETFSAGSGSESDGRHIYLRKDSTHRFFKYDVVGNALDPLSVNLYPDTTAVVGDKIWICDLADNPDVSWLYSMVNSGPVVHRVLLI